jgi:hypothetical protein
MFVLLRARANIGQANPLRSQSGAIICDHGPARIQGRLKLGIDGFNFCLGRKLLRRHSRSRKKFGGQQNILIHIKCRGSSLLSHGLLF